MSLIEINEPASVVAPVPEKHVVLALENVSKRFCRDLKRSLYYGVQDIAREVVGLSQRPDVLRKNEFWAIEDVNFELRSGDVLGMVGINGCGKTTLMRIIAGLIKPTTGSVTVRGRLAPLLALGAGFNQVLTGRENIFANMSVLGLTYEEIKDRFDEVVAFSEIGYAIDAPVQTYSSGMVARLGFACAINTQPDILLLDEVLAVGDLNFRRKCIERLLYMRSTGMSLVMVHHSPGMLLSVAEKGLYLKKGRVVDFGDIVPIIQQYESDLVSEVAPQTSGIATVQEEAESSSEAEILDVTIEGSDGGLVTSGSDAIVRAIFRIKKPVSQVNFYLFFLRLPSLESVQVNSESQRVLKMISRRDGGSLGSVEPGEYEVRIELPSLGLRDGVYQASLKMSRPVRINMASRNTKSFVLSSADGSASEYRQRRSWSVTTRDGKVIETKKFLGDAEAADDLLDIEGTA